MDGLSAVHATAFDDAVYQKGNAHGWLVKSSQSATTSYQLAGRLYVAKSGWLLLSVPNALVRGVFDALHAPGVELPLAGAMNVPNVDGDLLNAHISVMTAAEVDAVGANKINERGHTFRYTLGPVKEVPVNNIDGVSKVWFIEVASPELTALRKSYGLSPKLKDDEPFHITVAVRRRNVLRENEVSKGYKTSAETSDGHRICNTPETTYDCSCSGRCTCPDTCICKKSGYCQHSKAAEELPWRERVEVYTRHPQSGKIYGGVWTGDKSFAVPGGGVDPGETPEQAAIRELAEETGIQAANPVRLPIPPVDYPWSDAVRAEKAKIGRGNFAGSRTHFVMADFVKKLKQHELDKWEATNRKFYAPDAALALMQGKQFGAPAVAAGRMAALKHILEQAAKKTAAEVQPRVRVVLPYKGQYLLETLNNPKWPQNLGKRRFIGGGVEAGETPAQAAARELFEELGVKVKPTAFSALGTDPDKPHEHYLQLVKHKLKPGDFNATVGSDPVITLTQGLPAGDDYIGPDIKKLLAPVLKKAADLLHGGEADNMPDSQFPPKALAEGKRHEHEHTTNDQIAKEIAKDHLQEDPAYYEKEKLNQKEAMPEIIRKLREAKEHSDAKRYDRKNAILRELMSKAPDEWHVDDPVSYHMGITHAPTKFRFHADPKIIPVGVKVKAAEANPYWAQLLNTTPVIDRNKSLWQNFFNHLRTVKAKGDWQHDARGQNEAWRAALIPGYREQMNMAIARGQYPKVNQTAHIIRNYGDSILNRFA